METKDKQERLRTLINLARLAGVCKTQKEFADFMGMSEHTISSALRGREGYLTENFFARIENAFNEAGISINGDNTAPVNNQQGEGLTNTQEQTQPLEKLIEEMRAQREMYDRQFTEVLKQNTQLINIIARNNG